MESLRQRIYQCLLESDALTKVSMTECLYRDLRSTEPDSSFNEESTFPIEVPGYPSNLELVSPAKVKQRKLSSPEGKAALIHAIAHIEFSAMNIAWDAVYRFPNMPKAFYSDWAQVALEEAKHFTMLNRYLNDLEHEYGDFPAHSGLWEVTHSTSQNVLHRMALVPRVFEARGLDVTPAITEKFRAIGDSRMVEILDIIYAEEVSHVEIGTRWFHYCCEREGVDPESTFQHLVSEHLKGVIRKPINSSARRSAGFTEPELDWLNAVAN